MDHEPFTDELILPGHVGDLVVDEGHGKLIRTVGSFLRQSNFDGSDDEQLFSWNRKITDLALDPRAPGDVNADGRVDLRDVAAVQNCFTGTGAPPKAGCAHFDADPADRDVDLADHRAFTPKLTGP